MPSGSMHMQNPPVLIHARRSQARHVRMAALHARAAWVHEGGWFEAGDRRRIALPRAARFWKVWHLTPVMSSVVHSHNAAAQQPGGTAAPAVTLVGCSSGSSGGIST